jgi:hypothetical protein
MNNTHSEANKFTPKSSKIGCHLLISIDSPQPLYLLCEHLYKRKLAYKQSTKQWMINGHKQNQCTKFTNTIMIKSHVIIYDKP